MVVPCCCCDLEFLAQLKCADAAVLWQRQARGSWEQQSVSDRVPLAARGAHKAGCSTQPRLSGEAADLVH
jgi:hypothetical protein